MITAAGNGGAGVWDYSYDAAGRLVTYAQHGADTFVYDERNRLVTSPAGSYSWDPRGTLDNIIGVDGVDVAFDGLGRMTGFTPDGEVTVDFVHDGLDRIATRNGAVFEYNGAALDPVSDGTSTYGRARPSRRPRRHHQPGHRRVGVVAAARPVR